MSIVLYEHPFAAFCQKVRVAFYELDVPFRTYLVEGAEGHAALAALWPIASMPVLRDESAELTLPESTAIIEYLGDLAPDGPKLIPADRREALQARLWDRFFDQYVAIPMQKIVGDSLRPEGRGDPDGVAQARSTLDDAYSALDAQLAPRRWAAGAAFTVADCAAAPALFYADWVHPVGDRFPGVVDYRRRILARPSVARVVEEARPYRKLFPGGAPDRD
jgi:glutathione S-transferase